MTDWTPESTEYLEGYLKQVSALTQHQGDDADDIVPELREHIVRETEDAAGSLVTLEHLRKVLAAVGTPEQVAGGEGIPPVMGDAAHGVPQRRETPPPVPPRAAPPQPIIVQHKSSSFTKGCIIAVVVLVLCALAVPVFSIIAAIAIPNLLRSRMAANEAGAAGAMRTISTGQVAFQMAGIRDDDGDGVGDYGTLEELANPGGTGAIAPFIDGLLGTGQKHGYVFTVSVTPGTATTQPSYTCTAVPAAAGRTGYRQFFVDESGIIRYTADGRTVSADSPPLN